ncbi:MAG: zinc ABC transporter ATP-binding protein AztA [Devosiaceae bacterium]
MRFEDLTLGYGPHPAVHGLSGEVQHGTLLAIIGPNGSGKSTLLKGIVGSLSPMSGVCEHADSCRKAYLPQQAEIDTSFPATVFDLVKLGLWHKRGLLGRMTKADHSLIANALGTVGLEGFEKRTIDTLSGGQLQRALFARVVLQDADLILLDEPFNAIDTKTVDDLVALITRWHSENRTVIAVMHDLDLVREHFPQTMLLSREPIAWGPTSDVVQAENLSKARRFHAVWDEDAPWCADHDHTHNRHSTGSDQGKAA